MFSRVFATIYGGFPLLVRPRLFPLFPLLRTHFLPVLSLYISRRGASRGRAHTCVRNVHMRVYCVYTGMRVCIVYTQECVCVWCAHRDACERFGKKRGGAYLYGKNTPQSCRRHTPLKRKRKKLSGYPLFVCIFLSAMI